MAQTIRQDEEMPAAYPEVPSNLSAAAQALDLDLIWQRIEAYTACRWTERNVTWIVEGPGPWFPPLKPAIVATVQTWRSDAWQAAPLNITAYGGYDLPGHGPFQFKGVAGDDDAEVPAAVTEAFRRLAEYSAAKPGKPGARSESIGAGSIRLSHTRSPTWLAEAIQLSGAADLLRPYRRA